ncbi:MAG: hypothetical protein Q9178_001727 [Gyalolechia marmorata]
MTGTQPLPSIDFDSLVSVGEKLVGMILCAQSNDQWRTEDLQNGWTKQKDVDPDPPEELESVLNQLRIPQSREFIRPAFMDQDKPFVDSNGNPDTPATGGYYHNIMIPFGHAIIANANFFPKYKAPGKSLPPLHHWSDVVWLSWAAEAGNGAKNLRYIFHSNIITQSTRDLLEYIRGAKPDNLNLPWPGVVYDPVTTKEGKAILATSHGQRVAYLLADHSDVLGRRVPVANVITVSSEEMDDGNDGMDGSSDSDSDDGSFLYYYILWELREATGADTPSQGALS